MLEKLPHAVGDALSGIRAGIGKTLYHDAFAAAPATIRVTSTGFSEGGAIPAAHTADGAGTSPPIAWTGLPEGAASAVLIVEDPDAPALQPLVHLIAWNLDARDRSVPTGAFAGPAGQGERHALGRNSFLQQAYLPPDPPPGHGPHRYLFQIYALDRALDLPASSGRGGVVEAMKGHVLAKGALTGTYERP